MSEKISEDLIRAAEMTSKGNFTEAWTKKALSKLPPALEHGLNQNTLATHLMKAYRIFEAEELESGSTDVKQHHRYEAMVMGRAFLETLREVGLGTVHL